MGPIRPEQPELFALEMKKIAEFDFVYTLDLQISSSQNQTWSIYTYLYDLG